MFSDCVNLKTACFLLGLCQAGSAAALGMGDINVQSQLGRPLQASVPLFGATADTRADCFSLGASAGSLAPPLRAKLSIERVGEQTRLFIRTPSAVNDPIVQFALISNCEVRLQREYVVLLDPPSVTTPALGEAAAAVPKQTQSGPASVSAPVQAGTRSRRSAHRPSRRTPVSAARSPTASTQKRAAPRTHSTPKESVPRLVLSGKQDVSSQRDAPVALHLDTRLPDLTQPRPESLTATELTDENTALGRKLAHLEAQLAALQRRNAELEAARHATPTANVAPVSPSQSNQWPLYLLAMAIVASLIALVAWLLRRNRPARSLPGDTPWTQSGMPEKTLSELNADMPAEPSSASRMPEIAAPQSTSGTEVKEDVLDQAEVFMAFGHGDLAIHLLQEHLRDAPTESPVPWLLLLDLLHREGDTAGYAAASAECRRYFNVNLTDHPISQDSEAGLGLEAYPHLLEQIVRSWNTPEISTFFHDLIYDNRGGTRIGFEPGAYRDILLLRTISEDTLALAA